MGPEWSEDQVKLHGQVWRLSVEFHAHDVGCQHTRSIEPKQRELPNLTPEGFIRQSLAT